jgi:hypothetical protein
MLTAAILAATIQITVPDGLAAQLTTACANLESQLNLDDAATLTQGACVEWLLQSFVKQVIVQGKVAEGQANADVEAAVIESTWPATDIADLKVCGDDELDTGEECDGTDDAACPAACTAACSCP